MRSVRRAPNLSACPWPIWVSCAVLGVAALGACATAATPPRTSKPAPVLLDRTCKFVGLESVEGPSDQNADSVSLLAVYRFGGPDAGRTERPLSLKFQVDRSRVNELQHHLESRPEVVCSPEANGRYTARVEPFHNESGKPQP